MWCYINTDIARGQISGMPAQGLINKNSNLNSNQKIMATFKNCHTADSGYLFIQIGHVMTNEIWKYIII